MVQMISDLTGKKIHRSTSAEMSAFGVAFMAGLDAGKQFTHVIHKPGGSKFPFPVQEVMRSNLGCISQCVVLFMFCLLFTKLPYTGRIADLARTSTLEIILIRKCHHKFLF